MLADKISGDQRRKNMRAVRSKDTEIELKLRKALWHKGYRYRKNYSGLTGKPDIVFIKHRLAVFCDSEFWHGFDWANKKSEIRSNREFWVSKIESNIKRDEFVDIELSRAGWRVLRFWGTEIKKNLDSCIDTIEQSLTCAAGSEIKP